MQHNYTHRSPINRSFHWIGVPMVLLAIPVFCVSWQLALLMIIGGSMLQDFGHSFEGVVPGEREESRKQWDQNS